MIQKILKTKCAVRIDLYVLPFLFLIFFSYHPLLGYSKVELKESKTPIQILEVSKSSFSLAPGQSDYMVLTLINVEDYDQKASITAKSSSDDIDFKYDEMFLMPANSVVRVPVDFSVSENIKSSLITGAFYINSNDENASLELKAMQPFEIKVRNLKISANNINAGNANTALLYLSIFSVFLALAYIKKKHEYMPALAMLAVGTYGIFTFIGNPFISFNDHIKTDSLDNIGTLENDTLPNDMVENATDIKIDYEYKTESSESYIDLHGTVLEEGSNTTFLYGTPIYFSEGQIPSDSTISGGSEDVNTADSPDISNSATEDADMEDLPAGTDEKDEILEDDIIEIKTYGSDVMYKTEFGFEVPIIRGFHTEYKGIEIRTLAFLMPQNIRRDLIRKYVGKALTMPDGGHVRQKVRRLCQILGKEEPGSTDIVEFQNALLRILKEQKISFDTVQEYTNSIFDDPENLMRENAKSLCDDFEKAHMSILDAVLKLVEPPKEPEDFEIVITPDADYIATPDIEISLLSTEELPMAADSTEIPKVKNVTKIVQKNNVAVENDKIRTFSIFDLPTEPFIQNDGGVNENKTSDVSDDDPVLVLLDLTASDLIEISIPTRIELPPLARQNNAYNSRNNMGEFQIRTFKDASDWRGFFTFDVIKLGNGTELSDMWLEIDGQKINPEKSRNKEKKYLNYQLGSNIFPENVADLYNFSPYIWIKVPAKAAPGVYSSNISFTLIQ